MLRQLMEHRWICYAQGGLTLLLGSCLVMLRSLMEDRMTGAFVAAVFLLGTGFVLVAAGLIDLAVALDVTTHQHKLKYALMWWVPGVIGVAAGAGILLTPHITMCLLAALAACHAILVTGIDLTILPGMVRHPRQQHLLLAECTAFVVFAALLAIAALRTELMATKAVGLYAIFFGLRLVYLGGQLTTAHHTSQVAPG